MDINKEYLTKEKFEDLQKELHGLQTVTRKKVAEQLEYAKGLGDLSENAEYQEARENQAKLEARISQLEALLKDAEIVSHKKGDTVEVGSTVQVKKAGESTVGEYHIVGSEEADFSKNKISLHSPLGSALLGKKKGDDFVFLSPKGKVSYSVIAVK